MPGDHTSIKVKIFACHMTLFGSTGHGSAVVLWAELFQSDLPAELAKRQLPGWQNLAKLFYVRSVIY
jgi:hypothetical protein